jgi:hypothetical protein
LGVIFCVYLLVASLFKYANYLTEVERAVSMNVPQDGSENIVKLPLKDLIINGLLNLLISILIAINVYKGTQMDRESTIIIYLPLSLVIPVTLFLEKFLMKSGLIGLWP